MEFNDTTTRTGLIQDCELFCGFSDEGISGDTDRLQNFTRGINNWARRVNSWIQKSDYRWQYDDSSYTDLPNAVTDLVDGQQDYELPDYAQEIEGVSVKNASGDWVKLQPFDALADLPATDPEEYMNEDGMPCKYDLRGRSIMLYPPVGSGYVTTSGGLKIYFSRDINEFNSTATTREPGFISDFHQILSYGASLDYCIGKGLRDRLGDLKIGISEMKSGIENHYSNNDKTDRPSIRPRHEETI